MARGDAAKKSAQSAENKQEEQQSDVQPDQTEQDAQEAAAQQPDGTPQVATAESSDDDEQAKPKWYEETQGRCPHPDSYDVVERGANRRSARQVAQANESEAALQS